MTRFDWTALEAQRSGFFRFYSSLIKFRITNPLLGRAEFLAAEDITWHEQDWHNTSSKFLAFTLHDRCARCPSSRAVLLPASGCSLHTQCLLTDLIPYDRQGFFQRSGKS